MEINPENRSVSENYKLMTGMIVPRPIAWITSLSNDGVLNLAPFSAYGMVTHSPPLLMVTIGTRNGSQKDTLRNILARREFVINVTNFEDASNVHASSEALPSGDSEVEHLGLSTLPGVTISTPRLARSPAAMECKLRDCIKYSDADSTILIAAVARFHIRDDLIADGKINTAQLDPLARIAGPNYGGLGRFVTMTPVPT